jgi:hypothetical protein
MDRPSNSVGGSDANVIAKGQAYALNRQLALFKGELEWGTPTWAMQLGTLTERLHYDYLLEQTPEAERLGWQVIFTAPDKPRRHCTTDGMVMLAGEKTPVELKHTHTNWDWNGLVLQYYGQIQHTMYCTETKQLMFSAVFGNLEPTQIIIDRDDAFIEELNEKIDEFLWNADNDVQYVAEKKAKPIEVAAPKSKGQKLEQDMSTNNQWASLADEFLKTKQAVANHNTCKDAIKELSAGSLKTYGHGVIVTTNKNGSKIIRVDKMPGAGF